MDQPWIKLLIGLLIVGYFVLRLRALHYKLSKRASEIKITWESIFAALVFTFAVMIVIKLVSSSFPWEGVWIGAPLATVIGLIIAFYYIWKK